MPSKSKRVFCLSSLGCVELFVVLALSHILLPAFSSAQAQEVRELPTSSRSAMADTTRYINYDTMKTFDREKVRSLIRGRELDDMDEEEFLSFLEQDYDRYIKAKELRVLPPPIADGCENGDFEQQYLAWEGAYSYNTNGIFWYEANDGGFTYPSTPSLPLNSTSYFAWSPTNICSLIQHNVEYATVGTDPVLDTYGVQMQRVHTGNYSMKINQNSACFGIDMLYRSFIVGPTTSNFSFWYALVLQAPTVHNDAENPFFLVRIKDASGVIVRTFGEPARLNNSAFFQPLPGEIVYREWSCEMIDLSDLVGQQVTVEFIASDCGKKAHYGYAYIDDVCCSCSGGIEGSIDVDTVPPCDSLPVTLCGDFTLPILNNTPGTLDSIKLDICQNGSVVGTLDNPVITGTQYCFSLNASDFPTVPPDGFDFVATASFTVGSYTYDKSSSTPGNGIIAGPNNDYLVECPGGDTSGYGQCCDSAGIFVVSDVVPGPAWWTMIVSSTLSTSSHPIIEIKADLVNFYMNDQTGCERCVAQTNRLGSLWNCNDPQSQIDWNGTLKSPTWTCSSPRNANTSTREFVWNDIVAGLYMPRPPLSSVPLNLRIVYPQPHIFQNTCCFDTLRFSIRWSFTDVECHTCDTLISYTHAQQFK